MPWRSNPTPYRVWLSEMMLQQTTVATVTSYFNRFIDAYPRLSDLAKADEQSVLSLWAGLGYYSRARNLLAAAKSIAHDENFPSTYESLLALKGVGVYTAGAVASIAYGLPVPLADTNVERVLGRYFALKRGQGFEKTIFAEADALVKEAHAQGIDAGLWNQALMEIGSLLCTPKGANCAACPLQSACAAHGEGSPLSYPGDKPKPPINNISETVTLRAYGGLLLLAQNKGRRRRGLWDLPLETEGEKLGLISYRISNDRVQRHIFLSTEPRPLKENENLFTIGQNLPPLCSPALKIIKKYDDIINKA